MICFNSFFIKKLILSSTFTLLISVGLRNQNYNFPLPQPTCDSYQEVMLRIPFRDRSRPASEVVLRNVLRSFLVTLLPTSVRDEVLSNLNRSAPYSQLLEVGVSPNGKGNTKDMEQLYSHIDDILLKIRKERNPLFFF